MLDQTIQRAVARDPARRVQTASELREALAAALREPVRARQRRRRLGYAVLGTCAVAVAAMTVVGVRNPDARARAAAVVKPAIERVRALRSQAFASAARPAAAQAQVTAAPTAPAEPTEPTATAEHVAEAPPPPPPLEAEPTELSEAASAEAEGEHDQAAVAAQAEHQETAEPAADPGTATAGRGAPTEGSAQPVAAADAPGKLEDQLAEAAEMMKSGNQIVALNRFRQIGKTHSTSPLALQAWSEAARRTKGWGEAYQVAVQWAEVDSSAEARMHLARMQRAVGKREDAIKTLSSLLQEDPTYEPARNLLQLIAGPAKVAMQ
jgi:tetratricopeptide (TPR) repeat protein